jgi:hypothetical protein
MYPATTDTHKHCRRCDTTLPHSAFGKNKNNPHGIHSECRDCAVARTRAWTAKRDATETHEERKRRQRAEKVKYTYGITLEEAEAMFQAQGCACRICGTTDFEDASWHIDHCHKTGAVRSILCPECNLGLGKFLDDPSLLRAAIDYLDEHHGDH